MVLGESDVGRSLVLVFSDGLDSGAWLSADEVLDIARRCDAVVYGVSAGQSPKSDFLADLSETTGGKLFKVESTKDLSAAFLSVLDEFRHRYVVSYSPRGVSPDGWHQLTVRVKGRNATVKARPGYFAGS
jgi:VWFA-related protein